MLDYKWYRTEFFEKSHKHLTGEVPGGDMEESANSALYTRPRCQRHAFSFLKLIIRHVAVFILSVTFHLSIYEHELLYFRWDRQGEGNGLASSKREYLAYFFC